MKTLLTIIMASIALSANAGRYYYRHYHYYGPRDDSGGIAFLVIIGIMLLLGFIAVIAEAFGEVKKTQKLTAKPITTTEIIISAVITMVGTLILITL